jgi:DnaK suppressor protein
VIPERDHALFYTQLSLTRVVFRYIKYKEQFVVSINRKGEVYMTEVARRDFSEFRQALTALRAQMKGGAQRDIADVREEGVNMVGQVRGDVADCSDADVGITVKTMMASFRRQSMAAIDLALQHLDNGTFGICWDCGHEISLRRLNAMPFASNCKDCAELAEVSRRGNGRKYNNIGLSLRA